MSMSLCLHPISFGYGDEGFTDDWAVVEVHPSMIAKLNFVGNAIDLAHCGRQANGVDGS